MLPLDERSCRSARGRSAKVRKITDSTSLREDAGRPIILCLPMEWLSRWGLL